MYFFYLDVHLWIWTAREERGMCEALYVILAQESCLFKYDISVKSGLFSKTIFLSHSLTYD